ncbi:MAG TPA: metallophosphoesterase, partial [Acidobacteriota bacterium]|nr:metallophosphoesterase [Acidobacteriota bacterium]
DLVIHAGDFVAPFTALELKNLKCPVKAVFGNCDGERAGLARVCQGWAEILEAPFEFVHAGVRFAVTHLDSAVDGILAANRCDIIVYGHTHKPVVKTENGILVVNPGETGGWLTGKSTVALLDPERRTAEIMPLE